MKILIAEDETPKLQNIRDFLVSNFATCSLEVTRSVKTTISALRRSTPRLVLLDMSLPTFEVAIGELGGRPQGFGGIEVLRYMDFYKIRAPVIVVTQYETFTENGKHVGLSVLEQRMLKDHPLTFRACVYYGALNDDWKLSLDRVIKPIIGESA